MDGYYAVVLRETYKRTGPNIGAKQTEPLDAIAGFHLGFLVIDDLNYFLLSHNCLPATLACCIGESLFPVNVIWL
jgi:hypothetical protein